MRTEEVALLLRKQRLQSTIARQREDWGHALAQLDALGGKVDDGLQPLLRLARRLQLPPMLLGLAGAALLVWRPKRGLTWLRRGWLLYLGLSQLRERLQHRG